MMTFPDRHVMTFRLESFSYSSPGKRNIQGVDSSFQDPGGDMNHSITGLFMVITSYNPQNIA